MGHVENEDADAAPAKRPSADRTLIVYLFANAKVGGDLAAKGAFGRPVLGHFAAAAMQTTWNYLFAFYC